MRVSSEEWKQWRNNTLLNSHCVIDRQKLMWCWNDRNCKWNPFSEKRAYNAWLVIQHDWSRIYLKMSSNIQQFQYQSKQIWYLLYFSPYVLFFVSSSKLLFICMSFFHPNTEMMRKNNKTFLAVEFVYCGNKISKKNIQTFTIA